MTRPGNVLSNPRPSVSVVIPAYRAESTIRRAVDSALAQTREPLEIIVVDDGSPDDQAALVERTYGDKVTLVRTPNRKTASARNAGIDQARGDLIAFLDADDYWEREKLARQVSVLEKHRDVGLIGGAYFLEVPGRPREPNAIRPSSRRWFEQVLRKRGAQAFRLGTMMWTGTVLVRRDALGTERFVTGLEPAEDRDLWARLVSQWPAYLMVEPLATAVLVEGSLSRASVERDIASMLRVVARHRGELGLLGSLLWRSHTLYSWAAREAAPGPALPPLLRSFLLWPLPYMGLVDCRPLGRTRRLLALLVKAARNLGVSGAGGARS